MKMLCFGLGLLLVAMCSATIGIELNHKLHVCKDCLKFKEKPIQRARIASIERIPEGCPKQGFVVRYPNGHSICYRESFHWAVVTHELFQKRTLGISQVLN